MADSCPDCGTRRYGGICSNCQEELYILENQAEWIDQPISAEFAEQAKAQREYLQRQK